MGRTYAGVLGPLALVAVVARGLRYGADVNSTLLAALVSLVGFAILGYFVGTAAGWIVEDSVRSKLLAQLAERDSADADSQGTAAR